MSYSVAVAESESFTVTHARKLASKVATDLLRIQRFYDRPSYQAIDDYEIELIELLKPDCLGTVTYGFWRNGAWAMAVRYRALPGGILVDDNDPGRIRPGLDVIGASFYSYLTYSDAWWQLTGDERETIRSRVPISRSGTPEPGVEGGYWEDDRSYSAGGRGLSRSTLRRW